MGNVKKSIAKRTRHQRQYDRRVNKRQMQTQESKINTCKALDTDLVVTESSGIESEVQDESSRSRNDTVIDDADIRPIYDEEPMAKMVVVAQNTNNTTIRFEKKIKFVEQPNGPAPDPETVDPDMIDQYYESVSQEQEVACLMLSIKAFHTCKQEDGQSVSSYLLKMKSYLDTLERLGNAMPNELGVSLILNSLNKDYDQIVQNYNMHIMGKTIAELHVMLKLYENGIPKKAKTPAVLAIREGKIQKDKKKPQGAMSKAKGKNKLAYAPKTKIPPPPKRDNPAKDSIYHHYKEVGYWRRNCSSYHAELKKRKNAGKASNSGFRRSKKLKHRALHLYMGNEMRATVEAIGSFDLILPSGLIIVLDNGHYAPTVTRGVVSISRYPKETMGYYFYYPPENKIFISRNAKFFENSFMVQEASGSNEGLEIIQEEDTQHSKNTSKEHDDVAPIEVEPQNVRVPVRRSTRIPQALDRYGYYVDVEEYELGDFNEPPNYKAALADPESDK
ncbi:hypothetical protein Tco_1006684 [Tanacetum coccineum]|uniref:Retroviral polymerase SH3-like domain-containing protein n=1 Tax=Tanacetum coccineum TaxID=301880 RepID=A0ABQ5FIR0_9ASTR